VSASPHRDLGTLVTAADGGDPDARAELFARLYGELRTLAEIQLQRASPEAGISSTTLLHELYLAMHGKRDSMFPDRSRFLASAAKAMRGLIVDSIRARRAEKRGGRFHLTTITTRAGEVLADETHHEALAEALDHLEEAEPDLAEIVNLNFFGGLTFAEIAALRGVALRTVMRDWRKARMFLKVAIEEP
jgi:RNA polymerase sigma factor (TIGR02999 family)